MTKITYNKDIIIKQVLKFIEDNEKFPSQSDLQKSKGFEYGYSRIKDLFDGIPNLKRAVGWLDSKTVRNEEEYITYLESKGVSNNSCLEWVGVLREGYGAVSYKNKLKSVHRLIYELKNNITLNSDQIILHKCHNKKCYNIEHLKVGTAKENAIDNVVYGLTNYENKAGKIHRPDNLSLPEIINFYITNSKKEGDCYLLSKDYFSVYYKEKRYTLSRLIVQLRDNLDYSDTTWVCRHVCNNKDCINPNHLIKGTNRENSLDTKSYNKQYKLTEEQVLIFLQEWKEKRYSISNISDFERIWSQKLNVSKNTITSIRLGNRWVDQYKEVFTNG